jgi:integrase
MGAGLHKLMIAPRGVLVRLGRSAGARRHASRTGGIVSKHRWWKGEHRVICRSLLTESKTESKHQHAQHRACEGVCQVWSSSLPTRDRPGELFALRLDDLGEDTINVWRSADSKTRTVGPTKNGRAREIVYPHMARDAVANAPKFDGQQLVFPGLNGQQLWASSFSWLWSPVRVAFGRPEMAFYELRHFAATYLLELGLSPADVAVQLGHTDGGALVMSTYDHPSERAARARILTALDGHDQGELAPLRRRAAGSVGKLSKRTIRQSKLRVGSHHCNAKGAK